MQLAQSYLQGMANPFDGVLEAYGQGQVLRQNKDTLQAQQAEQARKIQAQQALESLDWNDKNAIAQTVAQFPEYTKGVKDYYDNLEQKEQQSMLFDMSTSISALGSDRPDLAVQKMRDKAAAYNDMGLPDKAEEYSMMAEWMATDPQSARKALLMNYSLLAGKDAGAAYDSYSGANIAEDAAPIDRAKTQAETDELTTLTPLQAKKLEAEEVDTLASAKQKIATANNYDAKTTETLTLLPHEQARVDSATSLNTANAGLAATRADDIPIARADAQAQQEVSNQLAQLKLQLQSEANQVNRDRLGVQIKNLEFKQAQYAAGLTTKQIEKNLKNQERLAEYQSRKNSVASGKATISRLLNNKSGLAASVGAWDGRTPSLREDARRFEGDLETLKSQQFLTNIQAMKGMGALSNAEGAKVEQAVANLDLKGSEATIKKQLSIIFSSLQQLEKVAETEYKDLLSEVSTNQTGSTAGRSYMQYAN